MEEEEQAQEKSVKIVQEKEGGETEQEERGKKLQFTNRQQVQAKQEEPCD